MEVKDSAGAVLLRLTELDGITLGGPAGTLELLITVDQIAAAAWNSGVYNLTVSNGADTDMLLYGSFTLKSV